MDQHLPKPADLLLHYNYGAAAVKQWGRNTDILAKRSNLPRPSAPAPMAVHDQTDSIHQRGKDARNKRNGSVDSGAQDNWDEDDVMLFFWGNSQPALDRHTQEKQERTESMEQWRTAVTLRASMPPPADSQNLIPPP